MKLESKYEDFVMENVVGIPLGFVQASVYKWSMCV